MTDQNPDLSAAMAHAGLTLTPQGGNCEGWQREIQNGTSLVIGYDMGQAFGDPTDPRWGVSVFDLDGHEVNSSGWLTLESALQLAADWAR